MQDFGSRRLGERHSLPPSTYKGATMKTFLSIGSGPGIGLATAARFAKEGYRVILTSRNQTYLAEQVKALTQVGYSAVGRHVDAGDVSSVVSVVNAVESQFGSIDVLHFNSAAIHDGTVERETIEGFLQDLTINIGAGFAAIKGALPGMVTRKEGTLLLTGGALAKSPHPSYLSLSVGKAGVLNLVQGLFGALKNQGVHIATITIGTVVAPNSREAREIAELFWTLHAQAHADWTPEVVYPASQQ